MAELHEEVKRIADAAEKLLHETQRLRRDVGRLWQRVEPFEGEPNYPEVDLERIRIRNLKDGLLVIDKARREIKRCELILQHTESLMKGISADAISRAEMKPWLKG